MQTHDLHRCYRLATLLHDLADVASLACETEDPNRLQRIWWGLSEYLAFSAADALAIARLVDDPQPPEPAVSTRTLSNTFKCFHEATRRIATSPSPRPDVWKRIHSLLVSTVLIHVRRLAAIDLDRFDLDQKIHRIAFPDVPPLEFLDVRSLLADEDASKG